MPCRARASTYGAFESNAPCIILYIDTLLAEWLQLRAGRTAGAKSVEYKFCHRCEYQLAQLLGFRSEVRRAN